MLVLTRKINQQVRLGDNIRITVLQVGKGCIRLGIEAPREMKILRGELHELDQQATQSVSEAKVVPFVSQSPGTKEPQFGSSQAGLTEEAFSMLEMDLEAFAAEMLEAERAEEAEAASVREKRGNVQRTSPRETPELQVEKTADGVVYQTRHRAPLARFMRSTVRESDIAYSLF